MSFPRRLSAVIRELFARAGSLDPELATRLADWHAFHLTNFELQWPWDRWAHVLDKGPGDGQRRYEGGMGARACAARGAGGQSAGAHPPKNPSELSLSLSLSGTARC